MKAIYFPINLMEMVQYSIKMAESTMEAGKMEGKMDKVNSSGQMDPHILEIM